MVDRLVNEQFRLKCKPSPPARETYIRGDLDSEARTLIRVIVPNREMLCAEIVPEGDRIWPPMKAGPKLRTLAMCIEEKEDRGAFLWRHSLMCEVNPRLT